MTAKIERIAEALGGLYGDDISGETLHDAVQQGIITAAEAQMMMGYVLDPPKPAPESVRVVYGLEAYQAHLAGCRERARQDGIARMNARHAKMELALSQTPPKGSVLRNGQWVPIFGQVA